MLKKILIILILVLGVILRIYNISENPPSLNWDEASLGYNAFSIATSGRDEHGEFFPLARFIAFGDFKPPGYIYAAAISIGIFGLNEFAVRLPSILSGVFLVIATYCISKELFGKNKLSYIAMFFMAISPWGIHFSRGAFEANMAASLNAWALYAFLKGRNNRYILIISYILFVLSFYTFNANRIIAPLLLTTVSLVYIKDILKAKKWFFLGCIIAIIMILPSVGYLLDRESKVRFQEVSIFNNLETLKKSNARIAAENGNLVAKIIYNRRVLFALDYVKHLTENLSLRFLFTHGDGNPRLSVQGMGLLYVFELPFLIIGVFSLFKKRNKTSLVIFAWMFISLIPAGTAKETPHALRIISILPTFQIITALGMFTVLEWLKNKKIFLSLSVIITFCVYLSVLYFLHMYMVHYPRNWAGQWQYGYKQMVEYVLNNKNKYENIYVTPGYGRPYIYFALYKPYSTEEFLLEKDADRDWFGFWTVNAIGNIKFTIPENNSFGKNALLVESNRELPPGFILLKEIKEPNRTVVFKIAEKK